MIDYCKKEDIEECVNLHMNTLREGLLYELGKDILKKVYYTAIMDKDSFLIANKERGEINGVALGTKNIKRFIRSIRDKYLFDVLKSTIRLTIKKPSATTTIISSVFYTGKYKGEVLFLFVREKDGRKGIGTLLINKTNTIFKQWGVPRYRVVLMDSNEGAKHFYEKNGFVLDSKHTFLDKCKLVYVKTLPK